MEARINFYPILHNFGTTAHYYHVKSSSDISYTQSTLPFRYLDDWKIIVRLLQFFEAGYHPLSAHFVLVSALDSHLYISEKIYWNWMDLNVGFLLKMGGARPIIIPASMRLFCAISDKKFNVSDAFMYWVIINLVVFNIDIINRFHFYSHYQSWCQTFFLSSLVDVDLLVWSFEIFHTTDASFWCDSLFQI